MSDSERLERALAHLSAQLENHARSAARPELSEIDREAIAESVTQRFKTAFSSFLLVLGIRAPSPEDDHCEFKAVEIKLAEAVQSGLLAGEPCQWSHVRGAWALLVRGEETSLDEGTASAAAFSNVMARGGFA